MEVVAKSRSVRQMVARTGLRRGSVVTPTVSTEIRASDQMVCNSALQQIAIAYFGFNAIVKETLQSTKKHGSYQEVYPGMP